MEYCCLSYTYVNAITNKSIRMNCCRVLQKIIRLSRNDMDGRIYNKQKGIGIDPIGRNP